MFRQNLYALHKVMDEFEDITSPQAVEAYFLYLFFVAGNNALDEKHIVELSNSMALEEIGKRFRIIEENTIPIYIPNDENAVLIQMLRDGTITKNGLRKLGRNSINVYRQHFDLLRSYMECPMGDTFGILLDMNQYDRNSGLSLEAISATNWYA